MKISQLFAMSWFDELSDVYQRKVGKFLYAADLKQKDYESLQRKL